MDDLGPLLGLGPSPCNLLTNPVNTIAVTTVGNSAPAVVRRVAEQLEAFTHTCFMVTPYSGYVDVAEKLSALTPAEDPHVHEDRGERL